MTKIAFVFPGQGSQSVGMGEDLAKLVENKDYFNSADETLGYSLSELMINGPQEELTITYNTQPALLTVGAMVSSLLQGEGVQPDFVAGHSLGEYTALVAAGKMTFEDGVKVVHNRGLYMNEAVPAGVGAMAAILGLDRDAIQVVTEKITAAGDAVQPANVNCPGQIVISGTANGVEKACEQLKEAGARRTVMLDVSGPFHSSLMEPAAEKLRETIESVELIETATPVVANVNAEVVVSNEQIPQLLVEQLYSPVLWEDSVRTMIDEGVTHFIECGPGKVLSGLIRKIDRSVNVWPVYDKKTLEAVVEAVKGWE